MSGVDHTKTGGEAKEYANKAEGFREINPACSEVSPNPQLTLLHIFLYFELHRSLRL
jgi:hypothetical protein